MNARALIIVLLLSLAACASPEKDWRLAERDDSQNAYLGFLAKHPDSEFAERARERIEELKVIRSWERAESKDSRDGYEFFTERYPNSEFTQIAAQRISEFERDESWETTLDSGSIEAFEEFLRQHPDAPQAAEADSMLAALRAEEPPAAEVEREGDYRVQLAAFRSVAKAEEEVRRLVEVAPGVLPGPIRIEPPETTSGGYFLLKSVPLSREEAAAACAQLKSLRQDCLIINR